MSTQINSDESQLTGLLSNYRFYSTNSNHSKSIINLESTTNYNFYQSSTYQTLLTNDVQIYCNNESNDKVDITGYTEDIDDNITTEIYAQLPLFYINKNLIKIPGKVAYALSRHTPKHLLRDIHDDVDVAIEMCLIFTTQLTSTYFEIKEGSDTKGWKSLKAEYLRELISINPLAYKKVVTALEYPLAKGQILECDHEYIVGEKNFHYRLGTSFIGKGIVSHQLKTKEALSVLNRHYFRALSASNQNPICQNLIKIYGDITLPNDEQIKKEAKRLIKLEYVTKKGKKLTFLNKHSKEYYKDADKRSFVEDAIEVFKYLTDNGLMIPVPCDDKSGGRVVDSFTLMPSWIRRLVKHNGKTLIECDYTALHPNIAIKLYGGETEFISHGDLASDLKIDVKAVKVEHLSFFNKNVWTMKQSPLYEYYSKHEPTMLENIIREKYSSEYKHKITSRRMFKLEVDVMTDVIQQLNAVGIYPLYVYDALLCLPKHTEMVLKIMDEAILKHGVKTITKCTSSRKYNPIAANLKETKLDVSILKMLQPNGNKEKTVTKENLLRIDADEINFNIGIKDSILERINAGDKPVFIEAIIRFYDGEMVKDNVLLANDPLNKKLKYVTQSHLYAHTTLSA